MPIFVASPPPEPALDPVALLDELLAEKGHITRAEVRDVRDRLAAARK